MPALGNGPPPTALPSHRNSGAHASPFPLCSCTRIWSTGHCGCHSFGGSPGVRAYSMACNTQHTLYVHFRFLKVEVCWARASTRLTAHAGHQGTSRPALRGLIILSNSPYYSTREAEPSTCPVLLGMGVQADSSFLHDKQRHNKQPYTLIFNLLDCWSKVLVV